MDVQAENPSGGLTLGFCTECIRVRFLGIVDQEATKANGTAFGTCTQCVREAEEDAELVGHAQDARDFEADARAARLRDICAGAKPGADELPSPDPKE